MTRSERSARWARSGLILLTVGAVAVSAARVTWHLRGHDRVMPTTAALRTPTPDTASKIDLESTLAFAPFGRADVVANEQGAPVAKLDLELLGVIVRDDPARSLALIRVSGTENNFRVDDEISKGTKITVIAQDHVTLNTNGTDRKLYFAGSDAETGPKDVPTGSERLQALLMSGQGTSISDQIDAAQRAQPQTTQDYIDLWRDRIIANPSEVLETIGLVASEKGYTIAEQHDVGVTRAGLKAGDIVTSVNGQKVGNVDKDRALYDVIADSGFARIEIERNGRIITMSFPLK